MYVIYIKWKNKQFRAFKIMFKGQILIFQIEIMILCKHFLKP